MKRAKLGNNAVRLQIIALSLGFGLSAVTETVSALETSPASSVAASSAATPGSGKKTLSAKKTRTKKRSRVRTIDRASAESAHGDYQSWNDRWGSKTQKWVMNALVAGARISDESSATPSMARSSKPKAQPPKNVLPPKQMASVPPGVPQNPQTPAPQPPPPSPPQPPVLPAAPEVPAPMGKFEPPPVSVKLKLLDNGGQGNDTQKGGLGLIVKDPQAAVLLGKALFWDVQVGSNGETCATCHFHAGEDNRVRNTVNPGKNGIFETVSGPNAKLSIDNFPLHDFASQTPVDDVVGSQGTFGGNFTHIVMDDGGSGQSPNHGPSESCEKKADGTFNVGGIGVRKVTGRNAPSVINACMNFRNFWDGRANNIFNGVNPFGRRSEDATIWMADGTGVAQQAQVEAENASCASQAVGPPLNDTEMSCAGKTFADLGRKLLASTALAKQKVHYADSVFRGHVRPLSPAEMKAPLAVQKMRDGGLVKDGQPLTYAELVKMAFVDKFWSETAGEKFGVPAADKDKPNAEKHFYNQMEANFSLFFGLAIQAYESTLISDEVKFDPLDTSKLTAEEQMGAKMFGAIPGAGNRGGVKTGIPKFDCTECHVADNSLFTNAVILPEPPDVPGFPVPPLVLMERMQLGEALDPVTGHPLPGVPPVAIYDVGFYNLGVNKTEYDLGIGGEDPFQHPLSFTEQYLKYGGETDPADSTIMIGIGPDRFDLSLCVIDLFCQTVNPNNEKTVTKGAFKVPNLLNVELRGPYFHDGSAATLDQVVDFYAMGGGRMNPNDEKDPIDPFVATPAQKKAVVAFLKTLTDERVRWEKAPFDHPELPVAQGSVGDETATPSGDGVLADDQTMVIPAVGSAGRAADGGAALKTFEETLKQ